MSSVKVKGRIKAILDVESGVSKAGKDWQKQSFVIDTGDSFNPDLCISLFGNDKVAELGRFAIGQEVEVSINLYSREYSGKYYHNVDGFRIDLVGNASQGIPAGGPSPINLGNAPINEPAITAPAAISESGADDDLPF
ncbi:MAG: hypothetical protein RL632_241 [Bacteroidota bacterium]|jgi:hypothetical protein